jgi:hypothetical protein
MRAAHPKLAGRCSVPLSHTADAWCHAPCCPRQSSPTSISHSVWSGSCESGASLVLGGMRCGKQAKQSRTPDTALDGTTTRSLWYSTILNRSCLRGWFFTEALAPAKPARQSTAALAERRYTMSARSGPDSFRQGEQCVRLPAQSYLGSCTGLSPAPRQQGLALVLCAFRIFWRSPS